MKTRLPTPFRLSLLCLVFAIPLRGDDSPVATSSPADPAASAAHMPAPAPPTLTVDALVAQVLADNPELRFYEAEIAAAKAGARLASRRSDPELSFDLGRKRVRDSAGGLVGEGTAWSVRVTQSFEWPGRLALRKAVANRNIELAELGLSRFRAALAARARNTALALQGSSARSAAIAEVAERYRELRETYLARDPAGITPLLETRSIEASEIVMQHRASEAGLALQAALIELNQFRGADLLSPLRIAAPDLGLTDAPAPDVLLAAARENNFEFKLRRAELELHGDEVRLARHERYPAIDVSPFYSQENAGEREAVAGVGFSLPLPVSGRNRAAVNTAEIRERQAEVALRVAQRELEKEVLTAAQAYRVRLADLRACSPQTLEKFHDAAALADRHYRLGAVPLGTYIELQDRYLDAVDAFVSTQAEAIAAGLKLEELTGLELGLSEEKK